MNDLLILIAVFVAVLLVGFTTARIFFQRQEIKRNIENVTVERSARDMRVDRIFASENDDIQHYYEVLKRNEPEGLEIRLIRAGFFSRDAKRTFNLIRLAVSIVVFVLTWYILLNVVSYSTSASAIVFSALASGVFFILVNVMLDKLGRENQVSYRKIFPDFMDLLVVCVDSGMSIEAAIDRVAQEFVHTKPSFGRHLSIISLEVRAGRPLHEALANFSTRIKLDEARTLAVLFRQSQELGSSVVKTLRVYSKEMRLHRLIRAEEKANSLPIKMLFPLAVFLFPVNLIIVLAPILMQIMRMFTTMTPDL